MQADNNVFKKCFENLILNGQIFVLFALYSLNICLENVPEKLLEKHLKTVSATLS